MTTQQDPLWKYISILKIPESAEDAEKLKAGKEPFIDSVVSGIDECPDCHKESEILITNIYMPAAGINVPLKYRIEPHSFEECLRLFEKYHKKLGRNEKEIKALVALKRSCAGIPLYDTLFDGLSPYEVLLRKAEIVKMAQTSIGMLQWVFSKDAKGTLKTNDIALAYEESKKNLARIFQMFDFK